jgi:phosphatidylinositol-3-phosphatase
MTVSNTVSITIAGKPSGGIPRFPHVVHLMLENQDQATIIGSSSLAPYLNSLAKAYAYCSDYHGLFNVSLPNYLALTCGATPLTADDEPPSSYQLSNKNLADLVEAAGLSWNCFAELLPSTCYQGKTKLPFSVHHIPYLYYSDITKNATRCAKIVPLTAWDALTTPSYSMVVPDNDHNSHNSPNDVPVSDAWCKAFLEPLIGSSTFQAGKVLLLITYDNGWSGNGIGPSPCIIAAPQVIPGTVISAARGHYDTLRTIEEALGLGTLTSHDAGAHPFVEAF